MAPDVYMADRFTVPQRAAEGVLEELPADVAGMSSQYLPFAWAETQFQGKTYALPFDTDARALWYNKDLITAAGEDPAQLDISKGAPTIETVTRIADKIAKKDASGNYDVMGWMPGGPGAGGNPGAFDQGWHYTWGFVNGGSVRRPGDVQGHADRPRRRCRLPVPVRLVKGSRSAGDQPLGHDEPGRPIRPPRRTRSGPASWA